MNKENKRAIIVLHEIYGINPFIKKKCREFQNAGFDVYCPDLIGREPFAYDESQKAYEHFMQHTGFDIYRDVNESVNQLKEQYEKVVITGFSIGATIAWRCCENALCDGIVACYGSRIRDYTCLKPACPVLLLFAQEKSFLVDSVIGSLQGNKNLKIQKFDAPHGFMDSFSPYFDMRTSKRAEKSVYTFLIETGVILEHPSSI